MNGERFDNGPASARGNHCAQCGHPMSHHGYRGCKYGLCWCSLGYDEWDRAGAARWYNRARWCAAVVFLAAGAHIATCVAAAHALGGIVWLDIASGVLTAEGGLTATGKGLLWLGTGMGFASGAGNLFVEWVRTRWWEHKVATVMFASASALATLLSFATAP